MASSKSSYAKNTSFIWTDFARAKIEVLHGTIENIKDFLCCFHQKPNPGRILGVGAVFGFIGRCFCISAEKPVVLLHSENTEGMEVPRGKTKKMDQVLGKCQVRPKIFK